MQYESELNRAYDCLKSDYEELKRQHLALIKRFQESELRRLSLEALKYNLEQNLNKFNNDNSLRRHHSKSVTTSVKCIDCLVQDVLFVRK